MMNMTVMTISSATLKFDLTDADKTRLIESLRALSTGENLESAINVDEVLRYFTVQVFVVEPGQLSGKNRSQLFPVRKGWYSQYPAWHIIWRSPTYSLGMPDPINDSTYYVNYPINSASGKIMRNRPLYHNLMKERILFTVSLLFRSVNNRIFRKRAFSKKLVQQTNVMIAPYVEQDPTAFCSYEEYQLAVDHD